MSWNLVPSITPLNLKRKEVEYSTIPFFQKSKEPWHIVIMGFNILLALKRFRNGYCVIFLAEERYRANIFLSFNFFTHDKLKLYIVLYKSCYLSPNFSPALVCKFLVFSGLPNSLFNFMLSVVTCYRLKPELLSLRPYGNRDFETVSCSQHGVFILLR